MIVNIICIILHNLFQISKLCIFLHNLFQSSKEIMHYIYIKILYYWNKKIQYVLNIPLLFHLYDIYIIYLAFFIL
jgi:hypothetical protein